MKTVFKYVVTIEVKHDTPVSRSWLRREARAVLPKCRSWLVCGASVRPNVVYEVQCLRVVEEQNETK
jgi:hypothetical protein